MLNFDAMHLLAVIYQPNNMFLMTGNTETKGMLGAFSPITAFSRYRRSGPLNYLLSTFGAPLKWPLV